MAIDLGVGKVSVGSDISGIFDQDLRIASICSVFLIILIRYLHLHKCLCVSSVDVIVIYSYFNKELRQVFIAITRVSAEKVFHFYLK